MTLLLAFALAVQFELDIRASDDELWLTVTRKPLDQWEGDDEPDLFTGLCDSGYCFI